MFLLAVSRQGPCYTVDMARKGFLTLTMLFLLGPALGAITLWGVDITGIEVQSGVYLIQNSVEDSAPAPVVNPLGLSLPLRFGEFFTFRPEVTIFWNSYGWNGQRAIPQESMFDGVMMMALLLNAQVGLEYPLLPQLSVAAELGLGFLPRFPVWFLGEGADQALDVTAWFVAGRFLYPNLSGAALWQVSELFTLALRFSWYIPLFQLWNSDPWWDQTILGLGLGIRFNL